MRLTRLFRQYPRTLASDVRNVAASGDDGFSVADLLPDGPPASTAVRLGWNGIERRSGTERRREDRRQDQAEALLDTRAGLDRRRRGRRSNDQPALRGFLLKA